MTLSRNPTALTLSYVRFCYCKKSKSKILPYNNFFINEESQRRYLTGSTQCDKFSRNVNNYIKHSTIAAEQNKSNDKEKHSKTTYKENLFSEENINSIRNDETTQVKRCEQLENEIINFIISVKSNISENAIQGCTNIINLCFKNNIQYFLFIKEKYVVGYVWALSKIISFLNETIITDKKIYLILKWKLVFFHTVNYIIQRDKSNKWKGSYVNLIQLISSFLSVEITKEEWNIIENGPFDRNNTYLEWKGDMNHWTDVLEETDQDQNQKKDIMNRKETNKKYHEYFRHMINNTEIYVMDKLQTLNLNIERNITFLELNNKFKTNTFKGTMNSFLFQKCLSQEQITKFTIFELCRFLNILLKYKINNENIETVISFIIKQILYKQIFIYKQKTLNFSSMLIKATTAVHNNINDNNTNNKWCATYSGNTSSDSTNNIYKSHQESALTSFVCRKTEINNCNVWLYDSSVRDIASLMRDLSRLCFYWNEDRKKNHSKSRKQEQYKQLCTILMECFLFKINKRQIGDIENWKWEHGRDTEIKTAWHHTQNELDDETVFKQFERIKKDTEEMFDFKCLEIRNLVDCLIGLANFKFEHTHFLSFFIKQIRQNEQYFFTPSNLENVILSFRNLLILNVLHFSIFDMFFNFFKKFKNDISVKHHVMIFYSIHKYVLKRKNYQLQKNSTNMNQVLYCLEKQPQKKKVEKRQVQEKKCKQKTKEEITVEQFLTYLSNCIFSRKEEINSIQGLVNFYFSLSNSINDLSIEKYNFFTKHFFYLLQREDETKEKLKIETVIQIFLCYYKNNIYDYKLFSYLLKHMDSFSNITIHNISTISFIAYHFNIINESLVRFIAQILFAEMRQIEHSYEQEQTKAEVGTVTGTGTGTGTGTEKNKNKREQQQEKQKEQEGIETAIKEKDIKQFSFSYDDKRAAQLHHLMKCVWSIMLSNFFLDCSKIIYIKLCILMKKILKRKMLLSKEEYQIIYQIYLCCYLYYTKNKCKEIFYHRISHLHFCIPYNILKEAVKSNNTRNKKVHSSSFQYKLATYFTQKNIKCISEFASKYCVLDFVLYKNNNPYIIVEVDGIYHFNITNEERYDYKYNNMFFIKNGRTVFRDSVLKILYLCKFVSVPWFFFFQTSSFRNLHELLKKKGLTKSKQKLNTHKKKKKMINS